tara:strand:- start:7180 stop:9645 length:2466 start_codon:yes stop_codon:yes gene_type:complete
MGVEKALGAGGGLAQDDPLEIELPDMGVTILTDDGGALIDFTGAEQVDALIEEGHDDNLAEKMPSADLKELASDLVSAYESDRKSREEWEKTYIQGLDLLGLTFEDRTKPWAGACGVFHPMLTEAVVRFQSQTIQEIFPATGPARTKILGKSTEDKEKQAKRVAHYLNYLATEKMVEYRTETEKLLFSLPIAGSAFRKTYWNPLLARPMSCFVPAEDFVVSYNTTDLSTCERSTHVMKKSPNEVLKLQAKGWYVDVELDEPTIQTSTVQQKYDELKGREEPSLRFDGMHTLLEMHVDLDLVGYEDKKVLVDLGDEETNSGIALPYVVTVDLSSRMILGIRRNWLKNDETKQVREFFAHYQYLPGLGFYGFGLVHMIGGLTKSATSILRQLIDAGTLSNLPGGLKARGLKIKGDNSPIEPGEFRDVDVPGTSIKDNIAFLPYKEPSNVLYQLLGDVVQEGRRFASAADLKASDINGDAPVGTTLALLEREMKVLSAVQARVHNSMGRELRQLAKVVEQYGPEDYPYEEDNGVALAEDFDGRVGIVPVSDPNSGTMAQRIMQHQAALQLASGAPHLYNLPLLHRQMLEVLGIRDAEDLVPTDEDMLPLDPVTENMNMITGKPTRAFLYQDHEAHIQTHMSATQNPDIMKMMEQNPNAKAMMAAMSAHIAEHLAFAYRAKVEQELGVELPPPEEPLPQDIELRISRLVAVASAQVTGKANRQKQAEENAEQSKDPIVQMRERELAMEEQKALAKAKNDAEALGLKRSKQEDDKNIAIGKIGAGIASDMLTAKASGDKLQSYERLAGLKVGMDIARNEIEGPDGV